TDGEEAGLLGADAFFGRDPVAAHVGFVVNMESRGNAGRAQMFQTGVGDGATIHLVQKTAIRPAASSLTGFIYEHMPNDTDFTITRKKGLGGLNYAFIGRQFDYHSPTSTPATVDLGTLQDMGQQVLATAGAAAFAAALPAKTPDVVYNQVFGDVLAAYPPWMGWVLIAVAAGLIAWGLARAWRMETIPWTDLLRGLGAGVFAALTAAAVLHWARLATGASFGFLEQRFLLAQAPRWEAALMFTGLGVLLVCVAELARGRRLVALLPLAAATASCLIGGVDRMAIGVGIAAALIGAAAYGRPVTRAGAWAGVLVLGLILAIAAQVMAPVAAFVVAWPLLVAAIGAAITAFAADRRDWGLVVLAVLAAVAAGWVGGFAHASYLSLDLPELLVLPVVLAAFVLWPLAQCSEGAPPERLAGPILLVIGVALTAAVRWNHPWDARHPQVAYVAYGVDQDAGKAWRVRLLGDNAPWSRAALTAGGGKIAPYEAWWIRGKAEAAPDRYLRLPAPTLSLDTTAGGLTLHAAPPPGARVLQLQLTPNTPVILQAIDGIPADVELKPGQPTRISWSAAPEGLDLTLKPAGPGKLTLKYAAVTESWPQGAAPLPKRPPDLMGFDLSDSTFAVGSRSFSW
ncbi:MAG: M28 family peptidase, partial [Caulobacteraceae bacterium]|nr:M28 family peptidase [Caulobacteraceae bacterium]